MQIGLLNPAGLPVAEAQVARKSLDPLDVQSANRRLRADDTPSVRRNARAFSVNLTPTIVALFSLGRGSGAMLFSHLGCWGGSTENVRSTTRNRVRHVTACDRESLAA